MILSMTETARAVRAERHFNMIITLETQSSGAPEGASMIVWLTFSEKYRYSTPRHGSIYRWVGTFDGEEIENDKPEAVTFNGIIKYRKFRHADGTEFYWGYGEGSPEYPDHGIIKVAQPIADGQ
jgi:hypothetical protein